MTDDINSKAYLEWLEVRAADAYEKGHYTQLIMIKGMIKDWYKRQEEGDE